MNPCFDSNIKFALIKHLLPISIYFLFSYPISNLNVVLGVQIVVESISKAGWLFN